MKQTYSISKTLVYVLFALMCALAMGSYAYAKIGVGMGAGEIRVTEDIKPGGIYVLPSLRVFNTGDETTTYGMNVAYHQDNPELRPAMTWFSFEPSTFTLEPGQSQEVTISMTVPVKALPGEYFSFLESGPVRTQAEGTSVGVAVATKLYFTVVPANIWQAFIYRMSAFMNTYAPWTWVGLSSVLGLLFVFFLTRFFSFNVALKAKKEGE